jgi:antitoxin CptB
MKDDPGYRRLLWRCRRGLLELDVMLQDFVETHYGELGDEELGRMGELLERPDQQLLEWLTGTEQDVEARLKGIVRKIRQHTDNKYK